MIQRIQTLLLLAVVILLGLNLAVPIWEGSDKTGTIVVDAFTIEYKPLSGAVDATGAAITEKVKNVMYIAILTCISIGLTIYTIFLYNNRPRQIKLSNFLTLLTLGLIGAYFMAIPAAKEMLTNLDSNGNYGLGYFVPIVCNILLLAARYFIRKDEALVKSVDRIR